MYRPVLSFFKEISLKKTITVGGGVNINDIYYTIFSNVLCFQLCSHPLPLRGQHYAISSESPGIDWSLYQVVSFYFQYFEHMTFLVDKKDM